MDSRKRKRQSVEGDKESLEGLVHSLLNEVKRLRGDVASLNGALEVNSILSCAQEGALSGEKELDLVNKGFTSQSLPHFGEKMHIYIKSITCLDLSFNRLDKFPVGLNNLPNLCDLFLAHNLIEVVPRSLGLLTSLRTLSLNHNRLRDLGEGIRMLSNLQELSLIGNRETLRYLPEGFRITLRWEPFLQRATVFDKTWYGQVKPGVVYALPSLLEICCNAILNHKEENESLTDQEADVEKMSIDKVGEGNENENEEEEEENEDEEEEEDDDEDYDDDEDAEDAEAPEEVVPDLSSLNRRGEFVLVNPKSFRVGGPNDAKDKREALTKLKDSYALGSIPVELQRTLKQGIKKGTCCSLCAKSFYGRPRVTIVSKLEYYHQKLLLRGEYCSVYCYRADQEKVIRNWHKLKPKTQQRQHQQQQRQNLTEEEEGGDAVVGDANGTMDTSMDGVMELDSYYQVEQHPDVSEALAKGLCSFNATGRKYRGHSRMWRCHTCNFVGDDPQEGSACCDSCAKVCHEGHDVAEVIVLGDWFCDCGAGLQGVQCKLLDDEGRRKRAEDVLQEDSEEEDD